MTDAQLIGQGLVQLTGGVAPRREGIHNVLVVDWHKDIDDPTSNKDQETHHHSQLKEVLP